MTPPPEIQLIRVEGTHREVGLQMGEATRDTVAAFGAGARHFGAVEELVRQIEAKTILVKGSRFMKMERVVAALTGTSEGGH